MKSQAWGFKGDKFLWLPFNCSADQFPSAKGVLQTPNGENSFILEQTPFQKGCKTTWQSYLPWKDLNSPLFDLWLALYNIAL